MRRYQLIFFFFFCRVWMIHSCILYPVDSLRRQIFCNAVLVLHCNLVINSNFFNIICIYLCIQNEYLCIFLIKKSRGPTSNSSLVTGVQRASCPLRTQWQAPFAALSRNPSGINCCHPFGLTIPGWPHPY